MLAEMADWWPRLSLVSLETEPSGPVSERADVQTGGTIHDGLHTLNVQDKWFELRLSEDFGQSAALCRDIRVFDKELALFNSCRESMGASLLYEMDALFPPTYPVHSALKGLPVFGNKRCVSWTDRIFFNKAVSQQMVDNKDGAQEIWEKLRRNSNPIVFGPTAESLEANAGAFYGSVQASKSVSDHSGVVLCLDIR